jgi:hypothetical protein
MASCVVVTTPLSKAAANKSISHAGTGVHATAQGGAAPVI